MPDTAKQPSLKIERLPDTTPSKLSIAVEPDLASDLEDYAAVYARTYGDEAQVAALIPSMLRAFIAADTGFKRARKALQDN